MVLVEQKGYEGLKKYLLGIERMNLKSLHEVLGDEVVQITEERFDKSVDPLGRKWKSLKHDYYKNGKMVRSKSDRPLKYRKLYKSFTYDANQDRVKIGTPLKHAKYHTNFPMNNGGARKRIPLREFMGIESKVDENRIMDTAVEWMETRMGK